MRVPHQIVDEALVVAGAFGSAPVGDAGGLHDGGIVPHIVHDADEAVIEDGEGLIENVLDGGDGRSSGFAPLGTERVYLGLLLGSDGHRGFRGGAPGLKTSARPATRYIIRWMMRSACSSVRPPWRVAMGPSRRTGSRSVRDSLSFSIWKNLPM